MKNHLQILSIVMAASLFGVVSNLAAAEPPSDWQNNMGPRNDGRLRAQDTAWARE